MIFRSFFARLSLLFLALILLFGGTSLLIAFRSSRHLFDEVEQLLNRDYAASIASELQPLLEDGFSPERIGEAIHYMMVLNPMVEIYLLDTEGTILAYFTHPKEQLLRKEISMGPVEDFIDSRGLQPVLGDDPRTEDTQKPFSAARLPMGETPGFVYVILRGQSFDRNLALVSANYYLKSGLITFLIALGATAALGLSLFFLLTRPLKLLSSAVKAFEGGDYQQRVAVEGNDEVSALSASFNDMAASIQEAMTRLTDTEKQRTDLIANISHDLRSPLTSLRGHLETILVKEKDLAPEQRQLFMETALKNVSSLQRLVEELFDLAKLEAGQFKTQREAFSLADLVQDVALKRKALTGEKGIRVEYRPVKNPETVEGDIALIERVLTNILDNAIVHSPEGGRIRIELRKSGDHQEISVHDQGPGIADEDLPHIFERFYRADKSRNREVPGTGLGLAIAREIVELHEGRIEARNHPAGGAVFIISLPIV